MYIAFAVKRLHASNCARTSPCLHACAYAHTCVRVCVCVCVCVCVRMQHDYDSFYPPGMAEKANAKSQLRCCAHSCCSCGAVPIRAAVAVQCLLEGNGDARVILFDRSFRGKKGMYCRTGVQSCMKVLLTGIAFHAHRQ